VDYHYDDFTEDAYRRLIRLAKAHWEFIAFADFQKPGRVCLWRHDIDLSVHRAFRLAQIEAEEGVHSTYFVLLHGIFYNFFEKEIARLLRGIRDLGHELALHFEPDFYGDRESGTIPLVDLLTFERQILETAFETRVCAFSWHNPTLGEPRMASDQDVVAGMVNAYGRGIRERFSYCSDSNGYWRFRRLTEVLEAGADEKLHVLTHPGWWTPAPMSPGKRVARCIEGRAAWQERVYQRMLQQAGREHVQ
jgi:hypothetical protein